MTKVLILNTGINGTNSNSNKLTANYIKQLDMVKPNTSISVRDLNNEALSHLTGEEMQAWMTPTAERSEQQNELAALSDNLIAELKAHDEIVIGLPMYNMGIPSTLKAYIDRIARAGATFKYTENGPQGLVTGKKVRLLAARGGQYMGTPFDTQTPYIQSIFGLIGITDVKFVYAEGLSMGEDVAANALEQAELEISELVKG